MKIWADLANRGLILSVSVLAVTVLFAGCQKKEIVTSADQTKSVETTVVEEPADANDDFNLEELEIDVMATADATDGATTGEEVNLSAGATTGSDVQLETDATTGDSFAPEMNSGTTGDDGATPVEIEVIEEEKTETSSIQTPKQNAFFF